MFACLFVCLIWEEWGMQFNSQHLPRDKLYDPTSLCV